MIKKWPGMKIQTRKVVTMAKARNLKMMGRQSLNPLKPNEFLLNVLSRKRK